MGYPMTYQRIINRNALHDGSYTATPSQWSLRVNLNSKAGLEQEQFDLLMIETYRDRLRDYEAQARLLAGDLRRLEQDAVDERALCEHIGSRTGLAPSVVAAVLKEFMSW